DAVVGAIDAPFRATTSCLGATVDPVILLRILITRFGAAGGGTNEDLWHPGPGLLVGNIAVAEPGRRRAERSCHHPVIVDSRLGPGVAFVLLEIGRVGRIVEIDELEDVV